MNPGRRKAFAPGYLISPPWGLDPKLVINEQGKLPQS
jgi:hypothetical protein